MKYSILAVLFVLVFCAFNAEAVDTTLTAPLTIVNPATGMKQYSFTVIPQENKVRATMRFVDTNSQVVQEKECEFVDSALVNATIAAGKVGQKYIDVLMLAIQTKCKGLWNLTGTDN